MNAGGTDYDSFLAGYRAAYEMDTDQLEELMLIRNALAQKAKDDNEDELNKK